MSVEELDKAIAETDPSALGQIEGVRQIASELGHPLEVVEVDPVLSEADLENLKKYQGFKAKLKLKSGLFIAWLRSRANDLLSYSYESAIQGKKKFKQGQEVFRTWPTSSKALFFGGILLFLSVIIFSYFAFVRKTLFYKQEVFITSLDSIATQTWVTAEDKSRDTFYNSSRIPKNIFTLKKIIVNIQPSENSSTNPMVAVELSLEGNSTEVLLEIKDREGEILDQVQRTTETYTYDELNTQDGKKSLNDKVRSAVNRLLTLGKIRRVYIQNMIFKP